MNSAMLLKELESLGSEQTRKTYARHGVAGACFGVSYKDLGILKKRIKTDHVLAKELWASGNHDAMILATMIADPGEMDRKLAESWVKDCANHGQTDALARVVAKSPAAREKAEKWLTSKQEQIGRAGWTVIGHLAMNDETLKDDYFESMLTAIEKEVHQSPNRKKQSMGFALIAIGGRNPQLQEKAIQAVRRIGKIEIDHGDTDCKTPDAETYILKMAQRKAAKQSKSARGK